MIHGAVGEGVMEGGGGYSIQRVNGMSLVGGPVFRRDFRGISDGFGQLIRTRNLDKLKKGLSGFVFKFVRIYFNLSEIILIDSTSISNLFEFFPNSSSPCNRPCSSWLNNR